MWVFCQLKHLTVLQTATDANPLHKHNALLENSKLNFCSCALPKISNKVLHMIMHAHNFLKHCQRKEKKKDDNMKQSSLNASL